DEITNQSCSYDQVKDQTDWCRSGKWHCESYDFPYQFQNWCKPGEHCSTRPGDKPSVCVKCEKNKILYNIESSPDTYCRRFSGNCSSDCSKCDSKSFVAEWVNNNYTEAEGCKACGPSDNQNPDLTVSPQMSITPTFSPTPTPIPYSCVMDPDCVKEGKNLHLCKLICTPK
ncbi:MAG: hypothetical protein M1268_01020, partial [Patescibacteria group bacterium]|nr:hypothetical protein [Patescibacteria group bacterium]